MFSVVSLSGKHNRERLEKDRGGASNAVPKDRNRDDRGPGPRPAKRLKEVALDKDAEARRREKSRRERFVADWLVYPVRKYTIQRLIPRIVQETSTRDI